MKSAATALLILFPSIASAADNSGQKFSFLSSILQMVAALALVVGLILLIWHFSGKLMRGLPVGQQLLSKHIRLVETRYLGPKKALLLFEVGGEYLLLSSSDTGLTFIKQIDMLEEIEVIEEKQEQSSFATLLTRLRQKQ
ncbi:MAG: flagellar biosynthetic protein FliO [Proteobacteria bacterium]|nr:flagellar biosynthetic protein FliO [Pseudomonadota bacterium]